VGWGCLSLATLALTREWRNELAGGEIVQGAEAATHLGVAQAAVAVEGSWLCHWLSDLVFVA
jgi:hypothetical protein